MGPVILRLIRSEDNQIEKELIDGLSFQSSYYRFLHSIKEATEKMVSKFCDIDYKNEIAIIAEYNSNNKKQEVNVVLPFKMLLFLGGTSVTFQPPWKAHRQCLDRSF